MRRTLPRARAVVVLRNPVDRAYSEYHMKVRAHSCIEMGPAPSPTAVVPRRRASSNMRKVFPP